MAPLRAVPMRASPPRLVTGSWVCQQILVTGRSEGASAGSWVLTNDIATVALSAPVGVMAVTTTENSWVDR